MGSSLVVRISKQLHFSDVSTYVVFYFRSQPRIVKKSTILLHPVDDDAVFLFSNYTGIHVRAMHRKFDIGPPFPPLTPTACCYRAECAK